MQQRGKRQEVDNLQLFRAERASHDYMQFIKYVFKYIYRKEFKENWHHGLVAEYLTACYMGQIRRLIINEPPRYGKSEEATICWDAWMKGQNPFLSMISASYSDDFATDHAKKTRDILLDPAYSIVFPDTVVAKDQKSKANWETTEGGMRLAVGTGGSLTGRGGEFLLLDDPHKPIDIETSQTARKKDITWIKNTFYSRLNDKKKGVIVCIMQRLHDQDATGYLLEQGDESGIPYEHVCITNKCDERKTYSFGNFRYVRERGELIWPEFEGPEEIAEARVMMSPQVFASQYDQNPIDEENRFFPEQFLLDYDYNNIPRDLVFYGSSDFAITEDDGDYTVHGVWGVDPGDNLFLVDMWRAQTQSDEWCQALLELHKKRQTRIWWTESGQIS